MRTLAYLVATVYSRWLTLAVRVAEERGSGRYTRISEGTWSLKRAVRFQEEQQGWVPRPKETDLWLLGQVPLCPPHPTPSSVSLWHYSLVSSAHTHPLATTLT